MLQKVIELIFEVEYLILDHIEAGRLAEAAGDWDTVESHTKALSRYGKLHNELNEYLSHCARAELAKMYIESDLPN